MNEQCSVCNGRHNDWANYYESWFVEKFGREERLRLEYDANNHVKYSVAQLEELLAQLRLIYEEQLENKAFRPRFAQKKILSGEWKSIAWKHYLAEA